MEQKDDGTVLRPSSYLGLVISFKQNDHRGQNCPAPSAQHRHRAAARDGAAKLAAKQVAAERCPPDPLLWV